MDSAGGLESGKPGLACLQSVEELLCFEEVPVDVSEATVLVDISLGHLLLLQGLDGLQL